MKRYIDAEKLIAEIERFRASEYGGNTLGDDVANGALDYVLEEIIPSLQQEQPDVDFEGAYKSYMQSRKDDLSGNAVTVNMKDLARHFFGLGKLNARKEKQ